ncbi:hypothetical protein I6J18_02060 [Peribacillus psychrosaccharolyticus]|uniref:Uncharacterized protein n=1 Tax=Peribacillus psychrosaccharolyticus TaxID=1407 RepID=A0A974NMM8_PERPY|nr:hypothetical protein [Peribacillus psychrosaccharolyticus]MEC2056062.1 hypothetical protein [Peribacillus psychrosaccharolyticus]MED3745503.1 hypothetical protein [Peribacillus psychrosaccharolyticus]QQT00741.1 hypothetical protein I6J18_02060 [Peribacillus psychrosaccharolyticus]
MNISEKLTQQQLLVILLDVYQNVRDKENIQIQTVIADLEKQLKVVIHS